jgi:23S rRNA pseudouridine2605 synthase/23S rRNA pseudouridine2604 synthase
MLQRLQKILSEQGVCSRRKAEEYITAGLVKVNGEVAILGQKADPLVDTIDVDGTVLKDRAEMLYYVMNKPVGVETSNVEREASTVPTVRDTLPPQLRGKVSPVGRLDKDSCGLLLFTNDGVLAYRLTHPKFNHEKEYEVTLDRPISPISCDKLRKGFIMDGVMTKPLVLKKMASTRVHIILTEGKNRQIRRMCQNVGYTVKELKRIRIMTLQDDKLKLGYTRALTQEEKTKLLQAVGLGA